MIRVNLVPQELLDKELAKQRLAQVSVVAAFLGVIFLIKSSDANYKMFAFRNDKRIMPNLP